MELKIGDIQETALITLAIRASETARPYARIKDDLAKRKSKPELHEHSLSWQWQSSVSGSSVA